MPIFTYKGYDATGAVKKGRIEADSAKAARGKLRSKDKIVVSEMKEEASSEKLKAKKSFSIGGGVKIGDISVMTRQFATLANAHVPLDESLRALISQVENTVLRNTLQAVKEQISEGKSLADAMSQYPAVFSRLYVNMVKAGESSGTLGLVFDRLADYQEKEVETRGQLVGAMTYPAVMLLANVGLIGYLVMSLVPKLQKVFTSLKAKLPIYTEMVIGLSEWLQKWWFTVPVFVFAAFFAFRTWTATPKGRYKFDDMMLKAPVFGPLIMRLQVSRFCQTLSTLLASGVPIIRALEITKNIISNAVIAQVLEDAKTAVQEGKNLGVCIEKSGRFPPLVVHMIMTGERTGQLEEMLGHVSKAYEAEVTRKIESMISLVEPVMTIMMAGSAGGIIAAIMVPMLGIMNQIR